MHSKNDTVYDLYEPFFKKYKNRNLFYTNAENFEEITVIEYKDYNWIFLRERIIPIRINGKMRFFPEIIFERKYSILTLKTYLDKKKKYPDFDYSQIFKVSTIFNINNKLKLFLFGPQLKEEAFYEDYFLYPRGSINMYTPYKTYKQLANDFPELMCKTLVDAKERIKKCLTSRGIAF